MLSLSPLKASASVTTFEDISARCTPTTAPSSGASSPTKRTLVGGLPSLEEIRERMTRKGLAVSSEDVSLGLQSTLTFPGKSAAHSDPIKSTDAVQTSSMTPLTASSEVRQVVSSITSASLSNRSSLRLSTNASFLNAPNLKHPLPSSPIRPSSYPLQHEWTLFYDTRAVDSSMPGFSSTSEPPLTPHTPNLSSSSWEANLRTIGTHSAVETFLNCFVHLRRPSQLDRHSSYHVFKDGIKPMWEDPRNAKGGKWTITFRLRNPALVDRSWLWLVLGLIGEQLDEKDETCGAVCSIRPRGNRIALWVRDRDDVEKVNRIGRKLVSLLELEKEPGVAMEFTAHDRSDEGKLEGLFSVQNTMQPVPFGVQLRSQNGSNKLPLGTAAASSVASKGDTCVPHINRPSTAEPYARLNGQRMDTFARSPPPAGSPFGALGKSLGLGISVRTSPNTSPRPSHAVAARPSSSTAPQQSSGSAFSWRTSMDRSVSPRRRDTAHGATTARSPSPFKAS